MCSLKISDGIDSVAKVAGVLPMRRLRSPSSVWSSCSTVLRLLLTGTFYVQELRVSALVAGAQAFGRNGIMACVRWSVALPSTILIYLGMFAAALFRSNIDVSRLVLTSGLLIRPSVSKQKLSVSPNNWRKST
jgi:multisubunit Na+/H+ antiporter MnhE subunit